MDEKFIFESPKLSLKPNRYFKDVDYPYLYQKRAILLMLKRSRHLCGDDVGLGKGHPLGTKVLTPIGWKMVGDLVVGDSLIGSDGKSIRVTNLFDRGSLPVYKVQFNDGTYVKVDEDHLWAVRTSDDQTVNRGFRVKSTKDLKKKLRYTNGNRIWRVPVVKSVNFDSTEDMVLDPYLLGCWLGDGCVTYIHALEGSGVLEEIKKLDLSRYKVSYHYRFHRVHFLGFSRKSSKERNLFREDLRDLGLWGKRSWEKFIPERYKFSSRENRLFLLQGLLDTDGGVYSDHCAYFSSSLRLCEDLAFLVRSLGGIARVKFRGVGRWKGKECRNAYKVSIRLPLGVVPVRAKEWVTEFKRPLNRLVSSIEPDGEEEVRCISVDADDNLYVTEDFIVTHNTVEAVINFSYIKSAKPETRALVFTEKIALEQWKDEFKKLCPDIKVRVLTTATHPNITKRIKAFRQNEYDVIITTYSMVYNYWKYLKEGMGKRWVLYADEPNVFKSTESILQSRMFSLVNDPNGCSRLYGLTATIIENRLEEAFGIFRIITPGTFGSYNDFIKDYCIQTEFGGKTRTTGYKNLSKFRKTIAPVFYGRLADDPEVEQELPEVITKDVPIRLGVEQSKKVLEAMDRIVELSTGQIKKVMLLPSLILAQQFCDAPDLQGFDIESAKLEAMVETLKGTLAGQRVIIYSKLRGVVDSIGTRFKKEGLEYVRITGAETYEEKLRSKERFMSDGKDKCNIIIITRAGQKAANLQKAAHLFFYNCPWSYGLYRQTVGRAKRTGSTHKYLGVYRYLALLHPTVAEWAGTEQTIDHHTLRTILRKQNLWKDVTGDKESIVTTDNDLVEIFKEITSSSRRAVLN